MSMKVDDANLRPFQSVLAAMERPLNGVEIGVASGDNAARLLERVPINHLWLVDPWGQYVQNNYTWDFAPFYPAVAQRFADNAKITIIREASETAVNRFADHSLDFAYIDACHEEDSTFRDIEAWVPKVKPGGWLAGHDFNWNWMGVVRAVLHAAHAADWNLTTMTPEWWVQL